MHVDPFRHASLRQPTVNVAVSTEATKILGSIEDIRRMATKYFDTIWLRLPIISQVRFLSRLATVFADPQADYIVLCLAIHLLLQQPAEGEKSMVSESYVMIKSFISMLESTGFWSLEVVQARLLVVFYELGHGIQDGASISIASCARSARLLGLNKKVWQERGDRYEEKVKAEEEKRVWWAVVNLDRWVDHPLPRCPKSEVVKNMLTDLPNQVHLSLQWRLPLHNRRPLNLRHASHRRHPMGPKCTSPSPHPSFYH